MPLGLADVQAKDPQQPPWPQTSLLSDGMEEDRRIVLLADQAVEQEASQAFTSSHNSFTRVPKHDKGRLVFFKKAAENLAFGSGFGGQALVCAPKKLTQGLSLRGCTFPLP